MDGLGGDGADSRPARGGWGGEEQRLGLGQGKESVVGARKKALLYSAETMVLDGNGDLQ